MHNDSASAYDHLRTGGTGFFEHHRRGLISVRGKESVQFLNGLITNDVAKLEDGAQMLAAFPNAQGRLLAVVRVLRKGDNFFFETEEATREKVYNNLFRFTFAGDFFVEDLSEQFRFVSTFGTLFESIRQAALVFASAAGTDFFVPLEDAEDFTKHLREQGTVQVPDELFEILRIESGIPLYGVDMDETTIVPELGLDGLISYNKGCYIGQEIIARIHFRGHVAKRLTGLVLNGDAEIARRGDAGNNAEARTSVRAERSSQTSSEAVEDITDAGATPLDRNLVTPDGKNAGRITSVTFSPKLGKTIALAYVRWDYLAEGTELAADGRSAIVRDLPFIPRIG